MPYDNSKPRYLPHLDDARILRVGLTPLASGPWIETDNDLGLFHRHKMRQRELHGDRVYRVTADSLPAQRELAAILRDYLCVHQAAHYRVDGGELYCPFAGIRTPLEGGEPLWNCSLWVADDLVIMEQGPDGYRLTAASLCSASHWRLEDKFGQPLARIHDPIPGFQRQLTPRIDRVLHNLHPGQPLIRYNWALQAGAALNAREMECAGVEVDSPLYYRTERQSLLRLPRTGAIAFTIRVYLHPLASLAEVEGALPALFTAIDQTPAELAAYKGFDRLAPALACYRAAL